MTRSRPSRRPRAAAAARLLAALPVTAALVAMAGPVAMALPASSAFFSVRLAVGAAPLCGELTCASAPCAASGITAFQSVYVSVIVDADAPGPVFDGVFYALSEDSRGTVATHLGAVACPGFLQAPGTAPEASGWASTDGCRPACTVVANHQYLILGTAQPIRFALGPSVDLGALVVLDCDNREVAAASVGSGGVDLPEGIDCGSGGSPGAETSWGGLKALYRSGRP